MLNWNDLRFVLAAQRAGSVGGAARALKVDQGTVSRRLAAIEEALGSRLFDRASDGLTMTVAGEALLSEAQAIEERVAAIEAKAAGADGRVAGVVRVTTSENLSLGFLLEDLLGVQVAHPELELEVVTGAGALNLLRREADLAIRVGPHARSSAQPNVIARKLGDVGLAFYGSEDYLREHPPVRLDEGLAGHSVVGFDESMASSPHAQWLADTATAARVAVRVNSILGAAVAVAAGSGLGILPCFVASQHPRLVRVLPGILHSSEVWLLVHPDLVRVARVKAVCDHVVARMKDRAAWLRGDAA